jgi:hypothetical protein
VQQERNKGEKKYSTNTSPSKWGITSNFDSSLYFHVFAPPISIKETKKT